MLKVKVRSHKRKREDKKKQLLSFNGLIICVDGVDGLTCCIHTLQCEKKQHFGQTYLRLSTDVKVVGSILHTGFDHWLTVEPVLYTHETV